MRIPSGTTDQIKYFIAIDSGDHITRKTGVTGFTVYRSRNGGTATAMTTPTVAELDSTNMPGVYTLLMDEDMTIGAGNDSEEMIFHITASGIDPVSGSIELYRRTVTSGETLTVASGIGEASVEQWKGTVPANLNGSQYVQIDLATWRGVAPAVLSGSRVSAQLDSTGLDATAASEIADAVLDEALSGHVAAGSLGKAIADIEVDAAAILVDTAEIGAAGAGLTEAGGTGDQFTALPTAAQNADAVWDELQSGHTGAGTFGKFLDTEVSGVGSDSAAVIADAVWDELQSGHVGAGTFGEIATEIAAILVDTAEIGAAGAGLTEAGGTGDHLTALATQASVNTIDSNVDAILIDTAEIGVAGAGLTNINLPDQTMNITGNLSGTVGGLTAAALADFFDTNSGTTYASAVAGSVVKEIADNASGSLTAAAVADAVWDESTTGHTTAGTFGEQVKTDIDAILVDTAEIGAAGAGLTEAGGTGDQFTAVPWNIAWDAEVQSEVTDALNAYDPPTKAELDSGFAGLNDPTAATIADAVWDEAQAGHVTAGTFGEVATEIAAILVDTAEIANLNDLSPAEVNAEVVDALNVDTYAEPGQGTPAATASLAAKIGYVYKAWRNKKEQTATTFSLYNDAGSTVDQKATVSDDATTATRGEIVTGP